MICGSCKATGTTVEHVRSCYAEKYAPASGEIRATLDLLGDVEAIEGIYMLDNIYVKVQIGTDTGRAYCKRWLAPPLGNGEYEWVYQGRAPLYRLTLADRINAEQAAQFGAVTGRCVFCSRKLTDERSIEVGYGPVCAEREGLPWGEVQYVLSEAPALEIEHDDECGEDIQSTGACRHGHAFRGDCNRSGCEHSR